MPSDNGNTSSCTSEIELKSLTSEANCEGCDDNHIGEEARGKYSLLQPRPLLPLAFCASIFVAIISSSRVVLSSKGSGTNHGAPHRPTFVRFYSPGHCGTRFLTEIFMTNDILSTTHSLDRFRNHKNQTAHLHYAPSLYWNEDNLYLGPYVRAVNLSVSRFQQHIGVERFLPTIPKNALDIDTTCLRRFERNCHARVAPERVFEDDLNRLQLKAWNREGNLTELNRFLVEDRLPKLVKIMNFFGRKDGLEQLVKFGHTHIFYDLENYHRELSKFFNVKWVRIRRKRINVARSFAQDRGGHRPDPCLSEKGVVVCPFDKMSLLKPSRIAWDAWTVFMQHLWFVDEIEARWRVLLQNQRDDTRMEIFTLKFQENSDSICPPDVDDLAAFMNVASPREVMGRMPHLSHITGPKMTQSEMEAEALRYANEAPWCRQNDLESPVGFELDCSTNAY